MKVIAFSGSPRKKGNTELLLEEVLKGVTDSGCSVNRFNLNVMRIKPCQGCGACYTTGVCIFEDDMFKIYDGIRSADRIILASPVFFSSVSAQVKIMVDRCQCFWSEKYLLKRTIPAGEFGRKGLLLLIGAMRVDSGIKCAEICSTAFFRTVSVPEHETIGLTGIDGKGEILEHPDALARAYEAGRKLVMK